MYVTSVYVIIVYHFALLSILNPYHLVIQLASEEDDDDDVVAPIGQTATDSLVSFYTII